MKIQLISEEVDLIPALKEGSVHIVAFAEEGFSFFKAYAEFALGFPVSQGVRFCSRINEADETGTLWPKGKLTAMPKRFFRDPEFDREGFRRCVRDAFVANRDYCKSSYMAFVFFCVQKYLDEIYENVAEIARSEFEGSELSRVSVYIDPLQKDD